MINLAVILAAGSGSRLKNYLDDKPKGLISLGGTTLIERSIQRLIENGIKKIVIGTGHFGEQFEKLQAGYSQVHCVNVPNYKDSGSFGTLYNLKESISEDFLLLESDLLYERKAIEEILHVAKRDVILTSNLTNSEDEVFVETDEQGYLLNMSKKKENLNKIDSEFVGISKFSYTSYLLLIDYADKKKEELNLDYEKAIVEISRQIPIYTSRIDKLIWGEVDNINHMQRILYDIYPKILLKENGVSEVKRNILLNPGPATTTDRIKYAQVVPDICPREEAFGQVMQFIAEELTSLVANKDNYTTVLFGGSGTAAVESILSSVVDERYILIINNGSYGKRMCQIAEAYGLHYIEYNSPIDQGLDDMKIENLLKNEGAKIAYLAIVHHETTSGLINDIDRIGQLCKKYHIQLIVDAMSSYAAIPIDMEELNISYLAASSNKNLQGMAGVSFVIANKEHLEQSKRIKKRSFYLHLYSQYQYFLTSKQMRFTPPVQTLYALKEALIETKEEGIFHRYNRYKKSWETLMVGLKRLNLKHLIDKENHGMLITAVIEPNNEKYDFKKMHDFLYQRGFTIYPGKIDQLNTFRIANIGAIDDKDIEKFIDALEEYLMSIHYLNHE